MKKQWWNDVLACMMLAICIFIILPFAGEPVLAEENKELQVIATGSETLESGTYIFDVLENETARIKEYQISADFAARYVTDGGRSYSADMYGVRAVVYLPDELAGYPVTEIASGAFRDAPFVKADIVVPNSIVKLAPLDNIRVNRYMLSMDHPTYKMMGNMLYEKEGTCLVQWIDPGTGTDVQVTLPEGTKKIGPYAFSGCQSLTEIVIPEGVTLIDMRAFHACTGLKQVVLPESLERLADFAFSGCSSLKEITLPDHLKSIGLGVFDDCVSLESLSIGAGKLTVEYYIHPEGPYYMGTELLRGCNSLKNVTVSPENPVIASQNGALIYKPENRLLCYFDKEAQCAVVPDGIATIGFSAFSGCNNLTEIVLPEGMNAIDDGAFRNCSNLTAIHLPDSLTWIGDRAFDNCSSLMKINWPDNLSVLGIGAFNNCSSLKEIVLPLGLSSIDPHTFQDCVSLTKVELPSGLTNIGDSAFSGCESLTEIDFPDSLRSIDSHAFYGCVSLTKVELPSGLTNIGDSAFRGCESLTEIDFPDSLRSIDSHAFYGCANLTEIDFPDSLWSIDSHAFYGCANLTEIELPAGLNSIGTNAFRDCDSLKEIVVPPSVTSIGGGAFRGCKVLQRLTLPANAEYGREMIHSSEMLSEIRFSGKIPVDEFMNGNVQSTSPVFQLANELMNEIKSRDAYVLVPQVLTAEEYSAWTGKLKGKAKKQVTSNYTKYNQEKLSKLDEKERNELLAAYPALDTTELYILKEIKDETKVMIAGYLAEGGYTEEDYLNSLAWCARAQMIPVCTGDTVEVVLQQNIYDGSCQMVIRLVNPMIEYKYRIQEKIESPAKQW